MNVWPRSHSCGQGSTLYRLLFFHGFKRQGKMEAAETGKSQAACGD